MITSDYLLSILPEIEDFSQIDTELESHVQLAQGYDGVIALLENIRTASFPCFIIEDRSMGNIDLDSGALDSYSIALWVMVQDATKEPSELFTIAYELVKKVLRILIRDSDMGVAPQGFDYSRISYFKRFGNDSVGYEILLQFREDIDLSL